MEAIKDVARFDRAVIKNPVITSDGYLKCDAVVVAHAGTIDYEVRPDGTPGMRTDYIAADELGKPESIATLKMLPMCNGHPKDLPKGFIDASTAKQKAIGHVGENINLDGETLVSSIMITDAKAVADYKNGKRGLSLAYLTDLIPSPGTANGKPYDFIQTNRRYNHLALCDAGRAGDVARIPDLANYDGIEIDHSTQPSQRSYVMLVSINLDGIEYKDQAPEVAKALERLKADNAALVAEKKTMSANLDAITAERDTGKAKITKLEADLTAMPGKIAEGVKSRAALEALVTPHLDEADKKAITDKSDLDLRKLVATKAFPTLKEKIATANDAYIMPVFDSAIETLAAANHDDAAARQRVAANGGKAANGTANQDALPKTVDQARAEMVERTKNLYKEEVKK
jgi:hypothetical protein